MDILPRSVHVTIDDGPSKTKMSLFKDLVSMQCPTVQCGDPLYTLELASGGSPPFEYELTKSSSGSLEISTWSNRKEDADSGGFTVVVKASLTGADGEISSV